MVSSKEVLYFAYGHNTDSEELLKRIPGSKDVGTAVLSDHQLVLRQFADIVPTTESRVVGVVWAIPASKIKVLDEIELDYERKKVAVTMKGNGRHVTVFTYFMLPAMRSPDPPTKQYVQWLKVGYKQHGIPARQLRDALLRRRPPSFFGRGGTQRCQEESPKCSARSRGTSCRSVCRGPKSRRRSPGSPKRGTLRS